ncbi:hypothetical protein OHA57_04615 [Streptomyces anulatus]|uniref:hypothetical protein n=1 Tax=Streptomyces anulatus TaxID=1892 RepID=UPI002DDAFFBD|nr:hypothetical protein [Streptomyces anulatus]WSC60061.1 hypothetical protein OHA57_04615 [Streptomyces anulatus]
MTEEPPAELLEFARTYTCGHCSGDTMRLAKEDDGVWHGYFSHDAGCPVVNGVISSIPDSVRALPPGADYREDS